MSGDTHPDDDADFLDEDFVVEDIGQGRELDDLFDESAPAEPPAGSSATRDAAGGDAADEDDLLFTDHTAQLDDEPAWQRGAFDEQGQSSWDGEPLDLESVGVPDAQEHEEPPVEDPQLDDARASFTAELGSMLQGEDEFALDGEAELELIGGEADDGISEFEQSGPFVLDDGEGLWSEDDEAAPVEAEPLVSATADDQDGLFELEAEGDAEAAPQDPYAPTFAIGELGEQFDASDTTSPSQGDGEDVALEELPLFDASGGAEEGLEEGWEPLPGTSMDALAEVDEVQRSDEELREEAQSFTAPNYGSVDGEAPDLEDVEGHDIYDDAEDEAEAVVIGGPGSRRGRWAAVAGTLLAATVVLGGGALVIARPELFGLRIEPQRIERVDLPRPRVEFAVAEPPRPVEQAPAVAPDATPVTTTQPIETAPVEPAPVETTPPSASPTGPQPAAPEQDDPQPIEPASPPAGIEPDAAVPAPVEVLGQGAPAPTDTVPVAQVWAEDLAGDGPAPEAAGKTEPGALARFGDGLLVGELGDPGRRQVRALDGVLPGSRAFAQLHNGNYFIGSVKQVAERTVTLRVEDGGEITLATAEIAQLTELGSADYDELQKATRGFVRLTNNNRLVGGILSRIADDHVVLEFRKNRVILPRSAVGEIVSGEGDQAVRLDTTREEEGWVRRIVERELGTGQPAEAPDKRQDPAPRSAPPK
ncbi:MAG: hypothetical protein H6835_13800 [Planctomycetes bacterium]|nr:hypothetical protein [Planctomycetota bacterium]